MYFSAEVELINTINTYTNIKRLDIYFHVFAHGLNLDRFRGKSLLLMMTKCLLQLLGIITTIKIQNS